MKLINFLGSFFFSFFLKFLYNKFGLVLKYATRTDKLDILVASGLLALSAWLTAPLISFKTNKSSCNRGTPAALVTHHRQIVFTYLSKLHIRFFHNLANQRQWHFIRASKTGPACPSIKLLFALSFVLLSSCSYCPWKPRQWGWSVCVFCVHIDQNLLFCTFFIWTQPQVAIKGTAVFNTLRWIHFSARDWHTAGMNGSVGYLHLSITCSS